MRIVIDINKNMNPSDTKGQAIASEIMLELGRIMGQYGMDIKQNTSVLKYFPNSESNQYYESVFK